MLTNFGKPNIFLNIPKCLLIVHNPFALSVSSDISSVVEEERLKFA